MTQQAPLYACILIREFPAQALLRLRPELRDTPSIVLDGEPPLQYVLSLNSKARTLGLTQGMTRVEADTFPGVTPLKRSRDEESSARAATFECTGAFTPRIEDRSIDSAFLCILDITGTRQLFGAPQQLSKALLKSIHSLKMHALIAIGGNADAVVAIARGATCSLSVIPHGKESTALAGLPLSVLDLSADHAEIFALWGIHTLGMLAELPEEALISRLGQDAKRLQQLARGELQHVFRPIEPSFTLIEHISLDTPIELLDSLLFVLSIMLEQLIHRVEVRALALATVTVTLGLEGSLKHVRSVRPAVPTNSKPIWLKLIHLDLDAHPPTAAIVAVTVSAEHGAASKVQLGLFSPQLPEPARLDVTLARIRAIVGDDRAGRVVLEDTHRGASGAESFRIEPFAVPSQKAARKRSEAVISKRPTPLAPASRLGMRQVRPPESISVTLHRGTPVSFYFRDRRYSVECAYGPWLSSSEWWRPSLWSNEQWDLVAHAEDGAPLCCCLLFTTTTNAWRMAALYD